MPLGRLVSAAGHWLLLMRRRVRCWSWACSIRLIEYSGMCWRYQLYGSWGCNRLLWRPHLCSTTCSVIRPCRIIIGIICVVLLLMGWRSTPPGIGLCGSISIGWSGWGWHSLRVTGGQLNSVVLITNVRSFSCICRNTSLNMMRWYADGKHNLVWARIRVITVSKIGLVKV